MPAPPTPTPAAATVPPAEPSAAPLEPTERASGPAWWRCVRVRQWPKNLLVAAAPLAAGSLVQPGVALGVLVAFGIFCLASAGCYLLNDAVDAQQDRLHPVKRRRPVASGEIRAAHAAAVGVLLMGVAVTLGSLWEPALGLTMGAYVALQAGYVAGLKHQPAIDLAVVASGFLLRAVAGGVATSTPMSSWFLLVATFGALFVVAGKRYSEMVRLGPDAGTRASLRHYSESYLRFVWTMSAGITVMVYLLWSLSGGGVSSGVPWEALSVAAFVLCLLRYAARVDQGSAEHPEEIVMRDRVLQGVGVVWVALVLVGALA